MSLSDVTVVANVEMILLTYPVTRMTILLGILRNTGCSHGFPAQEFKQEQVDDFVIVDSTKCGKIKIEQI